MTNNKPAQPTPTQLTTVIPPPARDPLARLMSQLDPIQLPLAKDLAGQLAPSSRRIYLNDLTIFLAWIKDSGLEPFTLTRSDIIAYQQHLRERYAKATANRMFVTSRRFLEEAVIRGLMPANPGAALRGFKTDVDETPHTDLTKDQANELFRAIDRSTNIGMRDYALIMLLLRTGIRRAECAALTLGDLSLKRGHNTLTIQHGKGDKRRVVKVQVDVMRTIDDYLVATGRKDESEEGKSRPLFVRILKGYHVPPKREETPLTDKAIEQIVRRNAKIIGVANLTPHGLRATFVTLALEAGAPLHKVQRQAGHADPRTTERYQKRKDDLDIAAGDFIHLDLADVVEKEKPNV